MPSSPRWPVANACAPGCRDDDACRVSHRELVSFHPLHLTAFVHDLFDDAEFGAAGVHHIGIVVAESLGLIWVVEIKIRLADEFLRIINARIGGKQFVATDIARLAIFPEDANRQGVEHLRQQFGWERIYHAPIMPQTWLRRR